MKFLNTLKELSASFTAKEHKRELGNCEECKMYFHIHPSAELLLVTRGELTVDFLGRDSERIGEGQCALIFPFQSHSYYRPEGSEYFRFNFVPSLTQSFFSQNAGNVGERSVFSIDTREYQPFLDSIRTGEVSLYKVKGFLYNMIADYGRQIPLSKKGSDESILGKVIAYIDSHKAEPITLSSTAQALGYNEKYLSRTINQSAGFGFSALVSMLRVEAASYLLRNTDRTVVDVAMACGFGSECSFYRQFKETTGYTPKEYRRTTPRPPAINDAVI